MSQNLDQKDLQILDLLQRNSNYSVKEIGEKIGLSFTPTYERIKYLEKNGFIEKYAAILNRKKIGIELVAYCNVTIRNQSKKSLDEFEEEIVKHDEVQEVLSLSGTYDSVSYTHLDVYKRQTVKKDAKSVTKAKKANTPRNPIVYCFLNCY